MSKLGGGGCFGDAEGKRNGTGLEGREMRDEEAKPE
jgi:hypothetical protein